METTKKINKLILLYLISSFIPLTILAQGNAVSFDGNGDYIDLGNSTSFQSTNFTIECYIYRSDWSTNSTKNFIIGNRIGGSGYSIEYGSNGSPSTIITVKTGAGNGSASYDMDGLNGWHHLAFTYDGSYMRLYVDGVLGPNGVKITPNNIYYTSAANLHISLEANPGSYGNYLNGKVDEVRFWNTALSQSTIQSWMNKSLSSEHPNYNSNLVAYYKANSSSGDTLYDETSNSLDGVLKDHSAFVTSYAPLPFQTIANGDWRANASTVWNAGWAPENTWHIVEINDSICLSDSIGRVDLVTINGSGQLIIDTNVVLDEIVIASGGELTINGTQSLTLAGDLTNNGGTFLIYPNGTFIDNDSVTNNGGTFIYQRPIDADGWHYVSSPVSGASSNIFWYAALYTSDEQNNQWLPVGANQNINVLKGYHAYFKSSLLGSGSKTVNFTGGAFNAGDFNTNLSLTGSTVSVSGYNMIGNPYPSFLDIDSITDDIIGNSRSLNTAIYVWEPASTNITTYNNGVKLNGATRYVAPCQAFYIQTNNNGEAFHLKSDFRTTYNSSSTSKFRDSKVSNYIKIKASKDQLFDEIAVRFSPEAKDVFDPYYDARKHMASNPNAPKVYTISEDLEELAINALEDNGFDRSIPLYFIPGVEGKNKLTLIVDKFEDINNIFLEDKKTGEMIDLRSQRDYEFESSFTDAPDRFMIHLLAIAGIANQGNNTSGLNEWDENNIDIFSSEKSIFINNESDQEINATIYNVRGQTIYSSTIKAGLNKINLPNANGGYYLVYLEDFEGKKITEKIFIQ